MTLITKLRNILGSVTHADRSSRIRQCVGNRDPRDKVTALGTENRSAGRVASHKGHRDDIPEVMEFQSTMEANLFRFYTRYKGLRCEYEPKWFRFPKGSNTLGIYGYTPDFKLTLGTDTWFIEVKGYVDERAIACQQLFKKYYPNFSIYTVTPVEYKKIKDLYAHKIDHWEY